MKELAYSNSGLAKNLLFLFLCYVAYVAETSKPAQEISAARNITRGLILILKLNFFYSIQFQRRK
jgi:hypothetical protein